MRQTSDPGGAQQLSRSYDSRLLAMGLQAQRAQSKQWQRSLTVILVRSEGVMVSEIVDLSCRSVFILDLSFMEVKI